MSDHSPNAAVTPGSPWWSVSELRGELDAILSLVNAARSYAHLDEERAARKFCDALNRAWNARARLSPDERPESDWPLLKALITDLPEEEGRTLLRSPELRELASVDPPILNHRKLLGRGFLGSVDEIPDDVRREAAEAHLKLRRRLEGLPEAPGEEERRSALARVADLLYVIRSNLQHGEKFASPDPVRVARDRLVSEKATHVLELFFDLLFARPSTSLVAYGSLAPGGAYHAELDGAGGEWIPAVVRGRLSHGPFPALTPVPAGSEISVELLRGAYGLPERWSRLDELEGASYQRVLVPAETQQGAPSLRISTRSHDRSADGATAGCGPRCAPVA